MSKKWNDKKGNKFVPNHKGNKGSGRKGVYKGQTNKNFNKNQPRFKVPSEARTNEQMGRIGAELAARPPVQCWGCGGPHYIKKCPQRRGYDQIS